MKRYRKQAKIAMAVALATTSLGNTIPTLSAQEEGQIQENNIDKKDETSEVENLPEIEETPEIEKLPTVEDEKQEEADPEIKDVVEETPTTEDAQIKNEEENSSVEKTGEEIILNEQYFPDAGFREFIKKECSINENEVLTEEKRNQVTRISVGGEFNNFRTDIRSLEGIQYFPNLERLSCSYQIELTGTLDLSANTKLKTVQTYKTKITRLNIDGLTNLTWFEVSENPNLVGEFDLRENTELEVLRATNTQITRLNVDGLTNLSEVRIQENPQLTGELDLSGNTELETVYAWNTAITRLNLDSLTNLRSISIQDNPNLVGDFDLRKNTELHFLRAYNTKISSLNLDDLTNLRRVEIANNPNLAGDFDLSKNTNLEVVYTWNTAITSLNLDGLTNLTEVCIQNNPNLVGEINLSGNTNLSLIYAYNTGITGLNINGLTNLTEVCIQQNPNLVGDFDLSENKGLETIRTWNTSISSLNINNLTNLTNVAIQDNPNLVGNFDLSGNTNLSIIYTNNTRITSLNINGLTNLTDVRIQDNPNLTGEFDLSKNTELSIIQAYKTNITSLNVDGLTNLTWFEVSQCPNLTGDFDLSKNTKLQAVYTWNTSINSLNLDGLTNLTEVCIQNNPNLVGEINLSGNTNLSLIYAYNTGITGLNINGLTNLTDVRIQDNPNLIGEFDLSKNTKLNIIQAYKTNITRLNVDGLTNLTWFEVSQCPNLTGDFDLSKNTNLQSVYTWNTAINSLNINGLTNLRIVEIANSPNLTGDFDLRGNSELERVNAHTTQISNINVTGLAKLKMFSVANTNVSGEFDFTGNTALEELVLNNTRVTRINTQGLRNLILVDISSNPQFVGAVDFTSNPSLKIINADNTNINSINVQGLLNLTHLGIANTPIPNLDVSTNTNLQLLDASTNLTWLNIGNNPNLATLIKKDSVIDLGQIGDSFNIATVTEAFRGIDPSKVTMVSGATYDETTGEVSGYQNGTPIVYRYDSGTMQNGEAATITVTLNFTKPLMASEIRINSYVGKEYDGNAVNNPTDITTTGSSGAVTFEWFRKTADGNWESLGEEAPMNAGEYGVKAHLAADLHYAATDSGEPTPFTITQASSSIRINSYEDKEWNGNPVSDPTDIERTQNNATVTFKYYRVDDMTTEITAPSEVGEYVVKAILSGDANYTDSESNLVHFRIVGLSSTITLTYEDQVYTGNPVQDPQYTVEGSAGAVTIEWYEASDLTTPLTQAPTNVGSYVVKVSVAGTTSHAGVSTTASFRITPAASTISINNYAGKMYDGTAVSNPTDINKAGSDGSVTFEWFRKTANGNWEPLEQAPVDAGNYGVKAHLAANQNYTEADSGEPTPFEITKATSSISINSYEGKVYDGTLASNPTEVTAIGSDGAITFEWFTKDENGQWISLGEEAPIDVGEYGVKAHLAANQNYTEADSGEPTPFEIIKATSTVEILGDLNKTYDKEAVKEPTIKVEGTSETATISWFKKEDDGITRAITWTALTSAPVNAGNYKVVVTVAENNNSLGTTVEQEFTIAKAETNVSIEGTLDKEYDGVEVVPTIKVEGNSGATTIEWYKKDANGVWELLTNAPKESGEYKIVVKVAEDENYLSAEVEQTFTISEKVEVPSTPEEGEDNTTTEEEKVEGVQTGDVSQTSMWTMLVGLSMSMMYFFRRKKNK